MAESKTGKGGAKGAGKPAAKDAPRKRRRLLARLRNPPRKTRECQAAAGTAESFAPPADYAPRLKKHYEEVVRPRLIEQFGYKNRFEVPGIEKIVLNMGVGEAVNDTKKVTLAAADLALIAGQKAGHYPCP